MRIYLETTILLIIFIGCIVWIMHDIEMNILGELRESRPVHVYDGVIEYMGHEYHHHAACEVCFIKEKE